MFLLKNNKTAKNVKTVNHPGSNFWSGFGRRFFEQRDLLKRLQEVVGQFLIVGQFRRPIGDYGFREKRFLLSHDEAHGQRRVSLMGCIL